MKLWSDTFANFAPLPERFAFCRLAADGSVVMAANRNPHLAWVGVPAGARSLALICCDPDVPSSGEDVNKPGRHVPRELPRVDFDHWVLFDLSPVVGALAEGGFSAGVVARGKPGPDAACGARQALNDYTGWFAGDDAMAGDYFGYDGPCPPWNDERLHRYVFTLYALDVDRLDLPAARPSGADVRAAMAGHILAEASWTGTYTLNAALRG
jgi:Raf kinase inhibitor-like YbhB/YbcL family protein